MVIQEQGTLDQGERAGMDRTRLSKIETGPNELKKSSINVYPAKTSVSKDSRLLLPISQTSPTAINRFDKAQQISGYPVLGQYFLSCGLKFLPLLGHPHRLDCYQNVLGSPAGAGFVVTRIIIHLPFED